MHPQASSRLAATALALACIFSGASAEGGIKIIGWGQNKAGLVPETPAPLADGFGKAVAVGPGGNYAAVGAEKAGGGAGAAFVFAPVSGMWTQQAVLGAEGPADAAGFGASVSADVNLAVGATSGDVFVFVSRGEGGAWTQTATFRGSEAEPFDGSGEAVSTRGDVVLVGAAKNSKVALEAGAAFVFQNFKGGSGSWWSERHLLRPADLQAGDQFGSSVAATGSYLAVGAVRGAGAAGATGAAYIFSYSGELLARLTPPGGGAGDRFGWSLGGDAASLAVGALGGGPRVGAAYVYSAAEWGAPPAKLLPSSPGGGFGAAVAASGRYLIIGSVYASNGPVPEAGRADIYERSDAGAWEHMRSFYHPGNDTMGALYGGAAAHVVVGLKAAYSGVLVDEDSDVAISRGKEPTGDGVPIVLVLAIACGVVGGLVVIIVAVFVARRRASRPEYMVRAGSKQVVPHNRPGDDLYKDGFTDMQPTCSWAGCGDVPEGG
eukprot:CAMPEP_0182865116 /NCGR_PEP_ID=MMETSP0034_2-20130328/7522_1 /TAXON_ID=156128 /ORGANISM="Nephroselmis pyriformis, Strain CCMP717" /LENGTH=490 /DNA_ID=CAMNT_0024997403 /DNA_START=162 /DNA_END=1630 /DNA_ORIENTATION=+